MSGGHFDYKQYQINEIIDSIERELNSQGKPKSKSELWMDDDYYKKYPEEKYYITHPKEIQEEFKNAIKILKQASVYTQRIDWYLSGDDGEESFLSRLNNELNKL